MKWHPVLTLRFRTIRRLHAPLGEGIVLTRDNALGLNLLRSTLLTSPIQEEPERTEGDVFGQRLHSPVQDRGTGMNEQQVPSRLKVRRSS